MCGCKKKILHIKGIKTIKQLNEYNKKIIKRNKKRNINIQK